MLTEKITQLFPDNPPPEPPDFARFRIQREREIIAAVAHKAITNVYGTEHLPSPIPFWWSADKVAYFAQGGAHRQPAYIAHVGARVSAFRARGNGVAGRAAA